jgi:hypothetical protein
MVHQLAATASGAALGHRAQSASPILARRPRTRIIGVWADGLGNLAAVRGLDTGLRGIGAK